MNEGAGRLKVLSVVGAGRSGTTILASILGEIEGFTSVGELRWLWERGLQEGRPCGCGRPPAECPVWRPVVAAARLELSSRVPARTLDDLVVAQRDLAGPLGLSRALHALGPGRSVEGWDSLSLVAGATRAALLSLAEATEATVVVDTSKRALDAAVMASIADVDSYVLHLVRDSRAVVHSWRRRKTFTVSGQTRSMGTRGLAGTVRRWSVNAVSAEALRHRLPPRQWLSLRYEDFADQPQHTIEAVIAFLQEPGSAPFVDERTARLAPNHIVAGNPSRFVTGDVVIRRDDAWRTEMPLRDQRLVAGLTSPLLLRYGYLRRSTRWP